MAFEMKLEWEDRIGRLRSDVWFSRISSYILVGIKRMLISPDPPTPAKLKSLAWSNTTDAGGFAWCTEVSGK
jgi:hypothetical protein